MLTTQRHYFCGDVLDESFLDMHAVHLVLWPVCGLYLAKIYGTPGSPYLSPPSQYTFQILLKITLILWKTV